MANLGKDTGAENLHQLLKLLFFYKVGHLNDGFVLWFNAKFLNLIKTTLLVDFLLRPFIDNYLSQTIFTEQMQSLMMSRHADTWMQPVKEIRICFRTNSVHNAGTDSYKVNNKCSSTWFNSNISSILPKRRLILFMQSLVLNQFWYCFVSVLDILNLKRQKCFSRMVLDFNVTL